MKPLKERQKDREYRAKVNAGEIEDQKMLLGVEPTEFAEGYRAEDDGKPEAGGGTGAPEKGGDGGTGQAKPLTQMTKAELKIYIAARGGKIEGNPPLGDLLAQAQELPADEGNGGTAGNGAGTGAGVAGGDTGEGSRTGLAGSGTPAGQNPPTDADAGGNAGGTPPTPPAGGWPTV